MGIFTSTLKQAEELNDINTMTILLSNIGTIHNHKGNYNKALKCLKKALTIDKEHGNIDRVGGWYNNIGNVYNNKNDQNKAFDYFTLSLKIGEELGDNRIRTPLGNLGVIYSSKGNYDLALDYLARSLKMCEVEGDKREIGVKFIAIGIIYFYKGDFDMSLDYCKRSLLINESLSDERWIIYTLQYIGVNYYYKFNPEKAIEYLEKSRAFRKKSELLDENLSIRTTTYLFLSYKNMGKEYDIKALHTLIKETRNIEFELNYALYELLEDTTYLETTYNQVQETADNLEPDVAAKFLNYPIPKAIVEEWKKVKSMNNAD